MLLILLIILKAVDRPDSIFDINKYKDDCPETQLNTVHSSYMDSARDCFKSSLGFIMPINKFIRKTTSRLKCSWQVIQYPVLNVSNCRLLCKSCCGSVRSGLYACCCCSASCLSSSSTNSSTECCVFRSIFLIVLSPSFFLPVRGSRHPAAPPPPPLSFSMCLTPVSLSSLSSIRLLPLSSVLVSFYLYTGLQTFPPMATLAMRAYP